MKLYFGQTSPYSRKVRIAILEKGLQDRIETELLNPFEAPLRIRKLNPIGKVPTLALDNGETLYDSPVICEYIDSLDSRVPLFPQDGPARWTALRLQALADGVLDAIYAISAENRRPENLRSSAVIAASAEKAQNGLDRFEAELADPDAPGLNGLSGIAEIAAACIPDYAELRGAAYFDWRAGRPRFAEWYAGVSDRAPVRSTRP